VNIGGDIYNGIVVYTGPLDFLVNTCFGMLPYRSLDFIYKPVDKKHVLPCGTVNYTVSEDYTRITEYTYLTGQDIDHTTIMEEYPMAFEGKPGQIPYYAIMNDENNALYERYLELFKTVKGFHALGRLAEYRYYNMDQIVERALDLADELSA
jgi:UDP-galactopyranose mutase